MKYFKELMEFVTLYKQDLSVVINVVFYVSNFSGTRSLM